MDDEILHEIPEFYMSAKANRVSATEIEANKVNNLEAQLKEKEAEVQSLAADILSLEVQADEAGQKLKGAIEVVSFYATPESFTVHVDSYGHKRITEQQGADLGTKARSFMEKIKEE